VRWQRSNYRRQRIKSPQNRTIAVLETKIAQRIYAKPLKYLVGATGLEPVTR
jgi:hypothetical protein